MMMPQAIDQSEIDAIKAKYEEEMKANPAIAVALQMTMEGEIAKTIARQRKEALEAGGELAERIKAENEEMRKQAEAAMASISPEQLAAIKEAQEKAKAEFERRKAELDSL